MPWPTAMIELCINPDLTVAHWPYPSRDWRFNKPLITAIRYVARAIQFCEIKPEKWTENDVSFFTWLFPEE